METQEYLNYIKNNITLDMLGNPTELGLLESLTAQEQINSLTFRLKDFLKSHKIWLSIALAATNKYSIQKASNYCYITRYDKIQEFVIDNYLPQLVDYKIQRKCKKEYDFNSSFKFTELTMPAGFEEAKNMPINEALTIIRNTLIGILPEDMQNVTFSKYKYIDSQVIQKYFTSTGASFIDAISKIILDQLIKENSRTTNINNNQSQPENADCERIDLDNLFNVQGSTPTSFGE